MPEPALFPVTPVQRVVAYLLELYADEFLLLPAMHYRWATPAGARDARASFAIMANDPAGAATFADRISSSLPLLGVTPETAPAIEAHLDDLLGHFDALLADQDFVLGAQMSLADCALMGPLYAHLYLDPVPGPMLRQRFPRVGYWIELMNHPQPSSFAGFLPGDALHPSLREILALIGRDAAPVVLDTVRDYEAWADAQDGAELEPPRGVNFHQTHLRGIELMRYTSPYTLWMLQRPLDAYRALDADGRAAVDRAVAGTGCEPLLAYAPRHRLDKRHFKLVSRRRDASHPG